MQGQQLKVHCDRLSYGGGRGVARHEGVVIFIEGAAPNEELLIEITKTHKKFYEAKIVEVLEASSSRRLAQCPVFERCGGCTWQHIEYTEQVQQKRDFLEHLLKKLKVTGLNADVLSAPAEYNYRNRIQLHCKNNEVGFFARRSNNIIPISECPVCEPAINNQIAQLSQNTPKSGKYELRVESDGAVRTTK